MARPPPRCFPEETDPEDIRSLLFEIRFLHADDSVRYVHEVECGSEESALALFKRLSHASVLELWSERGFVSRHDPNAPAESMFVLD